MGRKQENVVQINVNETDMNSKNEFMKYIFRWYD